jgi:hypothetical protein
MSAAILLDRLDGVRQVGHGRWVARCPVHEGRRPALAITETRDEVVLIHCFHGCAVGEIVGALGLDMSDLFPPRVPDVHGAKPMRRRFSAAQVLAAVSLELLEVLTILGAVARRGSITPSEHERLRRSISRVMVAEGYSRE